MARHSHADQLKLEIGALIDEIDAQVRIILNVIDSAKGIGDRVFQLHAGDSDVMMAGGILMNHVEPYSATLLERMRIARDHLRDYSERL